MIPKDRDHALKEIERINAIESEYKKNHDKKNHDIWCKYFDLKRELDEKERKEKEAVEKDHQKFMSKIYQEKAPYHQILEDSEEIFNLIELHINNTTAKELEHEFYTNHNYFREKVHVDPIGIIRNDDYLRIGIYILENKKPTNKYSLTIYINSIFGFLNENNYNQEITLRDAPTIKELQQWYEKNKSNLKWKRYREPISLNDYIEKHIQKEQKYAHAIELYKQREWKWAYLKYRKWYYEHHVSRGSTCDEYKEILELMKIFHTEKENLPLLINEIKSEDGLKELERRLKE